MGTLLWLGSELLANANLILILLVILGGASGLSLLYKKPFELMVPMYCGVVILSLFLCAVIGQLRIGAYIILVLSFVSLLYSLYAVAYKRNPRAVKLLCTPGALAFVLMFGYLCIMNAGREIEAWDDLSHWAISLKEMVRLDDLYVRNDSTLVMVRSYLPGTRLFQYLMCVLTGGYREYTGYLSLQLLTFSFVVPLFSLKRRWTPLTFFGLWSVVPLFAYLMPHIDPQYFSNSMYVDTLIGVISGYCLYKFSAFHQNQEKQYWLAFLVGGVLALAKHAGLVLVIAILISTVVSVSLAKERGKGEKGILLGQVSALFLGAIVVRGIWMLYLTRFPATLIGSRGLSQLSSNDLLMFVTGFADSTKYVIFWRFMKQLFFGKVFTYFPVPIGFIIAVMLAGVGLVYVRIKTSIVREKIRTFLVSSFVFGIVYCSFLVLAYLYSFSTHEALYLASMNRYVMTLVIGWLILSLGTAIEIWECLDTSRLRLSSKSNTILLSMLVVLVFVPTYKYIVVNKTVSFSANLPSFSSLEGVVSSPESRVFFVNMDDAGIMYHSANYLYDPIYLNPYGSWRISEQSVTQDNPYTKLLSPDEWERELLEGDYRYVYFHQVNSRIAHYANLFEASRPPFNNSLYKVLVQNRQVRLIEVRTGAP